MGRSERSPVTRLEDSSIVSEETISRRAKAPAERAAEAAERQEVAKNAPQADSGANDPDAPNGVNPERFLQTDSAENQHPLEISKRLQRKLEPPPPKPVIPNRIPLPEGKANYIALRQIPDTNPRRRSVRAKPWKTAKLKAWSDKQRAAKAQRRKACERKRKAKQVPEDQKQNTKAEQNTEAKPDRPKVSKRAIKAARKRRRVKFRERRQAQAMKICRAYGFTVQNTDGAADIKPTVTGMQGAKIDFDAIESDLKTKNNRKNLRKAAAAAKAQNPATATTTTNPKGVISIPPDRLSAIAHSLAAARTNNGPKLKTIYLHIRGKLRRAIERARLAREKHVRHNTLRHLQVLHQAVPPILLPLKQRVISAQAHRDWRSRGGSYAYQQKRVNTPPSLNRTRFKSVMSKLLSKTGERK